MTLPFSIALGIQMPSLLASDFLAKVAYVSEHIRAWQFADEGRETLLFDVADGREGAAEQIRVSVVEIAQRMCLTYRSFEPRVLVDHLTRSVSSQADPHESLLKDGHIVKFGSGRYGLGTMLVELIEVFDREFQKFAAKLNAKSRQFPALIGADTLERCRYIRSFPHSLNLVSHLREDIGSIQHFARTAHWNTTGLEFDNTDLGSVKCMLSPSVCFHWYAWLTEQRLASPQAVTAIGKCFRYESQNLEGLERLWDFTMREIIFAGDREFVLRQRDRSIEEACLILDTWGLSYQIVSAMDPFFVDDFATQSAFQLAFDLKYEIRARLPYKNSTLAIGSFNYHQDFFGKSFGITVADVVAHTGCTGFGLERLALAFLAQHGSDKRFWPDSVRSELA